MSHEMLRMIPAGQDCANAVDHRDSLLTASGTGVAGETTGEKGAENCVTGRRGSRCVGEETAICKQLVYQLVKILTAVHYRLHNS